MTAGNRSIGLSFDDGSLETYAVAWPLLRERGLTATVFVTTSLIGSDRPPKPWEESGLHVQGMAADQIVALDRDGIEIGSHGVNHYALPDLSDEALSAELAKSRVALESLLGHPVTTFSYPHGAFDARVRDAAAAAGYVSAWSCECVPLLHATDPLVLPRYPVHSSAVRRRDLDALMHDGDLARRLRARFSTTAQRPGWDVPLPPEDLRRKSPDRP